ncbi:MAG: glycosyltransferase family 4 protein [Anaerolineae bacterium]|nr:glycosyltransferase family 4 protein [Anaerolineae bacterium]
MRIAINAWFLSQPGTGSGQYLRGLLRGMAEAGIDHEILLVTPSGAFELEVPGLQVDIQTLSAAFWRGNLGKVLFEQVAFPWVCRRWGAELVHVPYWGSPLWPPVPTVVTIHDLIPLLLPAYRGGPLVRLYTRLVSATARRATWVLTDSQASKQDIQANLDVPEERVQAVYLAAAEHFRPEPRPEDEAIRRHYDLPQRYVLYLAGHDVRKNVAGLIEAFATVVQGDADVSLVVGGRLPAQSRPPLYDPRPLAQELGIAQDVHFVGWVEESHKPALYRGAACAVFASRYEGFGLPVLEALACGTPLITTTASSLPEIAGDAAMVVDPDDTAALAGAILACLVDETLAAELRQRGPVQAAQFRWADTARQTLAAYQQAAKRAGG